MHFILTNDCNAFDAVPAEASRSNIRESLTRCLRNEQIVLRASRRQDVRITEIIIALIGGRQVC